MAHELNPAQERALRENATLAPAIVIQLEDPDTGRPVYPVAEKDSDGNWTLKTSSVTHVDTSVLEDIVAKDSTLQTLIDSLNFENGRLKTDTVANVDTSVLEDIVAKDETLNTFKNLFNFDENNRLKTDTSTVETELGEIKTKLDELETSLKGQTVAEVKTESDATGDPPVTLTFEEDIEAIEISHEEDSRQDFEVNGITIPVSPGPGWRSPIGGTPSNEVTVPEGIDCVVKRLV